MPFIFVVVFIDVLGIGIALPVLPMLVGEFTLSRELQSYWYGALVVVYGVMQFFCAPLLGALSDRFGRRPVLRSGRCWAWGRISCCSRSAPRSR